MLRALPDSHCAAPAILLHECRSFHGWAAAASMRRHHRRVLACAVGRLTHRAAAAAFDTWASWVQMLQTCEHMSSHKLPAAACYTALCEANQLELDHLTTECGIRSHSDATAHRSCTAAGSAPWLRR